MNSLHIEQVGLKQSAQFGNLFLDYISGEEKLRNLYTYLPEINAFDQVLSDRKKIKINRSLLIERLLVQYKDIELTESFLQQIYSLGKDNTFTITTGHQLCLGTGPLYLILKTLTCIKMVERLKEKNPADHFVPVFWLASEDHDVEEINHFYVFGKKYTWETDQKGAVGRFHTEGIIELLDTIKDIPDWLKNAYKQSKTLAEATRKIIHHLFGTYGVIVIDGDDPELKKEFGHIAEQELVNMSAYSAMTVTNVHIEQLHYSTQVHPREINLFYLKDNLRERIEWKDDRYHILHTDHSFSKEELLKELSDHPERFSPNVVLRPLYENILLPDLVYVGGPGEIAYWLQLKEVFNTYNIFLPVIFPRMFSGVLNKAQHAKLQKAQISTSELFLSEFDLKQLVVARTGQKEVSIAKQTGEISEVFNEIIKVASETDASLDYWAQAEKTKVIKQLDDIEKKIRKAEERKHEEAIKSVGGIREKLLPNGKLQERQESLFTFSINDPEFIDNLYRHLDPFTFQIQIVSYE